MATRNDRGSLLWPRRLAGAALAIAAGVVVGWFLARPAWYLLDGSSRPRAAGSHCSCASTADLVIADFGNRLKLAVGSGLVLSSPVWLSQLYAASAPRAYREMRRALLAGAVVLFAIGAALAALTVRELLWMSGEGLITTGSYLSQAVVRLLIFGAVLELPLLLAVRRLELRRT